MSRDALGGDLLPFIFGAPGLPFAERVARYADVCQSEERRARVSENLVRSLGPEYAATLPTVRP